MTGGYLGYTPPPVRYCYYCRNRIYDEPHQFARKETCATCVEYFLEQMDRPGRIIKMPPPHSRK